MTNERQPIWHLDATGSIIKKCTISPVYLYSLVLRVDIFGEPCLPILEWLSDCHDTGTISTILFSWWLKVKGFFMAPNMIVVDCSWALLHAIAYAFNSMSLNRQLDLQWDALTGKILPSQFVTIRLCASHYIKSMSRRLEKLKLTKEVASIKCEVILKLKLCYQCKVHVLKCLGCLLSSQDFETLCAIFRDVIVSLCSQNVHPLCRDALRRLAFYETVRYLIEYEFYCLL